MTEQDLTHADVWVGTYRGISFEIRKRWVEEFAGDPAHDAWTYYIYIPEPMVPEVNRPRVFAKLRGPDERGRRFWNYYATELSSIYWHHGIAFYEIVGDQGLSPKTIKAGCDYSHLWDAERGYGYTLNTVLSEVRMTIEEARERFALRWRCGATGEWFDTEEEAKASREAWHKNYRAEREAEKAEAREIGGGK